MSLYEKLKSASSEEDVKDIYIRALGLKGYQKNLIDIQTKEIWFEAKIGSKNSTYAMFTQLLHYVQQALDHGETLPVFLSAIDTEKAALMKTEDVLPLLKKKVIKWGKSASGYTPEALEVVSSYIGTHFISYKLATHETEFIDAVKNAVRTGGIIRTPITPANLKSVFDKWVEKVGKELDGVEAQDYALLFFADIMHDGTVSTHRDLPAQLLYKDGAPIFSLGGKLYELGSKEGYRQFWTMFHKPPRSEFRDYMLERRDSLIPLDERQFKGAYFTPLHVVDAAYTKLTDVLGENWQEEYLVWDMCCGVGNLEVKHVNPRKIFMSTLDQPDVDIMRSTNTCVGAERFQYDYLNDDIADDGSIDYSLTNKLPESLRKAIASKKKILVLINPPYAEATNADNTAKGAEAKNKAGVAKTKVASTMMEEYGKASNELFTQFLARIAIEIPSATIAMFSTMKYVNSTNFEKFRNVWNAEYQDGFIVHSKAFDGLNGNFPIGFLIWKSFQDDASKREIVSVETEVLNKNAEPIGTKIFYNLPNASFLNNWIKRPKSNKENVVPLKNAVTPATGQIRVSNWSENAVAYMYCGVNDTQHAGQQTVLFSSPYGGGNGFYVNSDNLCQAAITFSVRQLVKHTWINHNDQFLQPTETLNEEFKNDSLVWMLFHGKNLSASANELEWEEKKWSIVNHFIPYTEEEVGAPDRFESDFMVQYLTNKTFSAEGQAVLDEGKNLWKSYFNHIDAHTVRDELKLNRPDVGWYQIRKAIQARNVSGDFPPTDFTPFETAYKQLTEKLQPQVYSLGFLRL